MIVMHDADDSLRALISAALRWPAEKFPLPFICRKGASLIDECFEMRCSGCYCTPFEIWRNGAPREAKEQCGLHRNLKPYRREHTTFSDDGERSVTRDQCWYCILDQENKIHKKEAQGQ